MLKERGKDGVTLLADAIRKERAEELERLQESTKPVNVADATAQFSHKATVKETPKSDTLPIPADDTGTPNDTDVDTTQAL